MTRLVAVVLLGLAGCQPPPGEAPETWPCGARPDGVIVRPVLCADDVPAGGEGGVGDLWLANDALRVVIRNPHGALTTTGVSGATAIDAAPWDAVDPLHEVIPIVDGGWLEASEVEVLDDGIRVAGTVRALPELGGAVEGGEREIIWRLDGAWLVAEGADGLWIQPRGAAQREDGRAIVDGVTLATGPTWATAPGVVLTADGDDRILVAPAAEALVELFPEGVRVAGEAPGASAIELLDDDVVVARVPVTEEGGFSTRAPPGVDGVRAVAAGHPPSATVRPGADLQLDVGAFAGVSVELVWAGRPRPARIDWEGPSGAGWAIVDAAGGLVPTGPGRVGLRIAGEVTAVDVAPDGTTPLAVELEGDRSPRLLAQLGAWSDRSHRASATSADVLLAHAAEGASYVVLVADHDVASGPRRPDGLPPFRGGAALRTDAGHELLVWPLGANPDREGHGAPDVRGLGARDAVARAMGGRDRDLLVPVEMLDALGAPWLAHPAPTFVRLGDPGPAGPTGGAWDPWFRWLDAGLPLLPVGASGEVRVAVPSPDNARGIDVEAGLARGWVAATTGPDIWLTVGDAGPGEVLHDETVAGPIAPLGALAIPSVHDAGRARLLGLLVDGELRGPWPIESPPERLVVPWDARWVALAAWGEEGAWAVTAPIWVRPPP